MEKGGYFLVITHEYWQQGFAKTAFRFAAGKVTIYQVFFH